MEGYAVTYNYGIRSFIILLFKIVFYQMHVHCLKHQITLKDIMKY